MLLIVARYSSHVWLSASLLRFHTLTLLAVASLVVLTHSLNHSSTYTVYRYCGCRRLSKLHSAVCSEYSSFYSMLLFTARARLPPLCHCLWDCRCNFRTHIHSSSLLFRLSDERSCALNCNETREQYHVCAFCAAASLVVLPLLPPLPPLRLSPPLSDHTHSLPHSLTRSLNYCSSLRRVSSPHVAPDADYLLLGM